mmetsp:Transcript_13096/g.24476  ORF Transcript_13096/g.24476 Transcript_13096/m.24476 type:complete len:540 (-) Transcript_13096:6-1625(-)
MPSIRKMAWRQEPESHAEYNRKLNERLRRLAHEEQNARLSEFYRDLPNVLDRVLGQWTEVPDLKLLVETMSLCSPGQDHNLYAAVQRPTAQGYRFRFPFNKLPKVTQTLLAKRQTSKLAPLYEKVEISQEDNVLLLPTFEFFMFTFMYEASRPRDSSVKWFSSPTFFEDMFASPFLILFSKYLLEGVHIPLLARLSEDYLLSEVARSPGSLPSKHCCEMLYVLVYFLQSSSQLLSDSYHVVSMEREAWLFALEPAFYYFYKHSCLHWSQGSQSYPTYIAEVWLRHLTPWTKDDALDDFFAYDFIKGVELEIDPVPRFTGRELFWEQYVTEHILFYTELFELFLRLLNNELSFRTQDFAFLQRLASVFQVEEGGWIICQHLNLQTLEDMAKSGSVSAAIDHKLTKYGVFHSSLSPFTSQAVRAMAETLLYKVASTKSDSKAFKSVWQSLFGIEVQDVPVKGKGLRAHDLKEVRLISNPWERPLRSDEWKVLYDISWGVAKLWDKARGKKVPVPSVNLRFLANPANIGFACALVGLVYLLC